jgi:hypothetical protein
MTCNCLTARSSPTDSQGKHNNATYRNNHRRLLTHDSQHCSNKGCAPPSTPDCTGLVCTDTGSCKNTCSCCLYQPRGPCKLPDNASQLLHLPCTTRLTAQTHTPTHCRYSAPRHNLDGEPGHPGDSLLYTSCTQDWPTRLCTLCNKADYASFCPRTQHLGPQKRCFECECQS